MLTTILLRTRIQGWYYWKGLLKDGLYRIDDGSMSINNVSKSRLNGVPGLAALSLSSTHSLNIHVAVTKSLLHKRLGHPSIKVLDKVIRGCNMKVSANEKFEFCKT